MKEIEIYTDGACRGNPGRGGYGVVLKYKSFRKELSCGYQHTTNNRMELLGAIVALEALKEPCQVKLYSDSSYLVNAITKGWLTKWQSNNWRKADKSKVVNVDLWQRLLGSLATQKVEFIWVKGHANNPENNRCDELATSAADDGNLIEDEGFTPEP